MSHELAIAVTTGGQVITGDGKGVVTVWAPEGTGVVTSWRAHDGPVRCMVLTQEENEVITSDDTSIVAWRLNTGQQRARFVNQQGTSFGAGGAMVLRASGERILTGSDSAIGAREWLIDSGRLKTMHYAESREATAHPAVAADASGERVFVGANDGIAYVWTLNPYDVSEIYTGDPKGIAALAVTPDGRELVALGAEDGVVRLFDVASGGSNGSVETGSEAVHALALTPDGKTLVTGGAHGTVAFWTFPDRTLRRKVAGHDAAVQRIAVSSDGRLIATCGMDGKAIVWDSATGEPNVTIALSAVTS